MSSYTLGTQILFRVFVRPGAVTTLVTMIPDAVATTAISVSSTAGFAPSGAFVLAGVTGDADARSETIAYTGLTATSFTGITRDASAASGRTYAASHSVGTSLWSLVDAATQTVTIKAPDGTVTTATPTHASTGTYTYLYEPTMSKTHAVRIVTTNPDSAAESQIWVMPSLVA